MPVPTTAVVVACNAVNVASGVFPLKHQELRLKYGQEAAVVQGTPVVTAVRFQQAAPAETTQKKQ